MIVRPEGLYCPAGGFFIDPRGRVDKALVTHAHSDHARPGHGNYLVSESCLPLLKLRLGQEIQAEGIAYGKVCKIGDAHVSFHPSRTYSGLFSDSSGGGWPGLGGEWRLQATTRPELRSVRACKVRCLCQRVYIWPTRLSLAGGRELSTSRSMPGGRKMWRPAVLDAFCLLPGEGPTVYCGVSILQLDQFLLTGRFTPFSRSMKNTGWSFPKVQKPKEGSGEWAGSMIVAPPAVEDAGWTRRFKGASEGLLRDGWPFGEPADAATLDRGFVLSDHADWSGLLEVIEGNRGRMHKINPWKWRTPGPLFTGAWS